MPFPTPPSASPDPPPARVRSASDPGALERVALAAGEARRLVEQACRRVRDAGRDYVRLTDDDAAPLAGLERVLGPAADDAATADEHYRRRWREAAALDDAQPPLPLGEPRRAAA